MLTAFERDAILAELITALNVWDPAAVFIGLYESIDDHGFDTIITDVTAPAGDAGTRQPVTTWSAAHVKLDGRAMVDSAAKLFKPGGAAASATVRGIYVADALTAGNLITWKPFPAPIVLSDSTRVVSVVARMCVDPRDGGGVWFDPVWFNG